MDFILANNRKSRVQLPATSPLTTIQHQHGFSGYLLETVQKIETPTHERQSQARRRIWERKYPRRYVNSILSGVIPLTVSSAYIDTPTVPDHAQEALPLNEGQSNGADENGSNLRSLASSTAKLFLRGVNESAGAFPPLKSVAGGLCYILENCEVRSSSGMQYPQRLQVHQRTKANTQTIESLAPRVKNRSALLCVAVSEGDFKERERRKQLKQ